MKQQGPGLSFKPCQHHGKSVGGGGGVAANLSVASPKEMTTTGIILRRLNGSCYHPTFYVNIRLTFQYENTVVKVLSGQSRPEL